MSYEGSNIVNCTTPVDRLEEAERRLSLVNGTMGIIDRNYSGVRGFLRILTGRGKLMRQEDLDILHRCESVLGDITQETGIRPNEVSKEKRERAERFVYDLTRVLTAVNEYSSRFNNLGVIDSVRIEIPIGDIGTGDLETFIK
jgi:hypothetical protein